jgi:hypothetical protein
MAALFANTSQFQYFENHPGVVFVSRDTVKTMHKILNINESYGYDFQTFFDLLQRVAEDQVNSEKSLKN